MRTVKFLILAAIFGWSFSTTQVAGNDTGLAQTPAGSIVMSKFRLFNNEVPFYEFRSSNEDQVVSLKVYNRFGDLVFSAEDKVCRWDGRSSNDQKLDNGIYVFRAEVVGVSPKILMLGDITLEKEE